MLKYEKLFYDRNEVINKMLKFNGMMIVCMILKIKHGYYEYKNNGDIEDSEGNVLGNGTGSHYYYDNGEIVDVAHTISGSYTTLVYMILLQLNKESIVHLKLQVL